MKRSGIKIERQSNMKRVVFWILSLIIISICSLVLSAIFWPDVFVILINIFWLILFAIAATFIALAFLVFIGLRKEAKKIMSIIFNGTLSILDILEFIDLLWKMFIKILKEFILFITPVLAGIVIVVIYLVVLIFYKQYGKGNDVTALTIILTFLLVVISGTLSLPKKNAQRGNLSWIKKVIKRFTECLRDGLEIMIFVFFLTIDSTNLFFLPPDLNNELHASIFGYDLMKTSITVDAQFTITLSLIIGAIVLELFRTLLILIMGGVRYYREGKIIMQNKNYTYAPVKLFKAAMNKSFRTSIDDFVKFTVFTSLIVLVFVFFPRLKLLSMMVASITNVMLDLIFTQRLKFSYGEDLLSKLISKIARLK